MTELTGFCWDTKQQNDPSNSAWSEALSTEEIGLLIEAAAKGRFEITEVDGAEYPLITLGCCQMDGDDIARQRMHYMAFRSLCTRGIVEHWGGGRFLLSADGQCLARDLARARQSRTQSVNGNNRSEM